MADSVTTGQEDRIIDGTGLTLLPGVIDPQAHFREPELEHKEDLFTASCVCAHGRVTSLPVMLTQAMTGRLFAEATKKG